jgi:putative transposase
MSATFTRRIIRGALVQFEGAIWTVVEVLNHEQLVIENSDGGRKAIPATSVKTCTDAQAGTRGDLQNVRSEVWESAKERYTLIRPLVELGPRKRTRSDVEKAAASSGRSVATIYRWLEKFETTGLMSSLVRAPRSDKGQKSLDTSVEKVIQETIDDFYLTSQRRSPAKTAEEVRKRCKGKGLPAPTESTVRKRIYSISGELALRRRRGSKAADEQYLPLVGSFPNADYPLAVVQIDHTPMDVIVVDDVHRLPIGRPYLTTAVDVHSKMVVGFYISLDPPGALSTGMCISQAILGKAAYLESLGLSDLEWPVWGIMRTIHTDNAKEFRGTMLGRAAEEYGIMCERRPKGQPRYGGHIERAFRTHMAEIHNELPGTTFSNVAAKMEYNSEGKAVMSMHALEKWFTVFLLGVYHQRQHDGNDGFPPIVKWHRGINGSETVRPTGIPFPVADEHTLRLDFLPYVERTVQEYGIQFEGITYWSDAIRRFMHAPDESSIVSKARFICRYDPRNLSKLWFYEPESKTYIELPYRDLTRPPVSLWELKQSRKILRKEAAASLNEELIFQSIDRMREIVAEESAKSKKARRTLQRGSAWQATSSKPAKASPKETVLTTDSAPQDEEDDIMPFDGIRES